MGKIMKIFKDEANVYTGNCYVNTVIFRGRIYGEFHGVGHGGIKFSLQLSNGQNKETGEWKRSASPKGDTMRPTGAWRKPTFADCTAFGEIAKRILKEYKPKDEIWIIAKYYSRQHDGKFYKGFIVRDIISEKEITNEANKSENYKTFEDDDLPF